MQLRDMFDLDELDVRLQEGLVLLKKHPTLPLGMLTYSTKCQLESQWDEVTTKCRGLIFELETDEIVAHCLPKFYNFGEHGKRPYAPPIPDLPFTVTDKADGSMGIIFHYADEWHVATKGSFDSEQARWAKQYIEARGDATDYLGPSETYLAEIIYPENRIVVDHQGREDLMLITMIDKYGREEPVQDYWDQEDSWPLGSVLRRYPERSLETWLELAEQNKNAWGEDSDGTKIEGYVVRFIDGTRVKIKLPDYLRLHRCLTGVSARTIWKYLVIEATMDKTFKEVLQLVGGHPKELEDARKAAGGPMLQLLENVPDEFYSWVQATSKGLLEEYAGILDTAEELFQDMSHLKANRKLFAIHALGLEPFFKSAVMLLLDGKDLYSMIWKKIYPGPSLPFKTGDE